jgi:hypothetical protein
MIKKIFLSLLLGATALAANPDPSNQFKFGDGTAGNKVLKFNRNQGGVNPLIQWTESANTLQFSNDGVNFSDIGSGSGSGGAGINILTNPGFESGIVQGWSNTGGAFLAVSAGSNLLIGKGSATFQAGTTGNFVASTLITVPNGLKGLSCAASMLYTGGDGNLVFEVVDGSANVLASTVLSAQTSPTTVPLTFICPTTGTMGVRVTSTATSALIALDQMSLGNNALLLVDQSSFAGSLKSQQTGTCSWSSGTPGFTNFAPNAACSASPVVTGGLSYVGSTIPGFAFNNMPAGEYLVVVQGIIGHNGGAGSVSYRLFDGTIASQAKSDYAATSVETGYSSLSLHLTVPTGGLNHNWSLQCDSGGATCLILNETAVTGSTDLTFYVYRFPSSTNPAVRPDMIANSWTGAHGPSCQWIVASSVYADPTYITSCTFTQYQNQNFGTVASQTDGTPGHYLPGIVFTPSRPGTYFVCASPILEMGAANIQIYGRLVDGSNNVVSNSGTLAIGTTNSGQSTHEMCGNYTATSTSPVTFKVQIAATSSQVDLGLAGGLADSIGWTIHQIDQQIPAPLLVGSVVSTSSGVEHLERAAITGSACSSDPCSYSGTPGVTAINRSGSGQYVVHFGANVFSQTPVCVAQPVNVVGTSVGISNDNVTNSSTSFGIATISFGATAVLTDSVWNVICMGPH